MSTLSYRMGHLALTVLLLGTTAVLPGAASSQAQSQLDQRTLRFVARDNDGQLVRNLAPEEIELLDNGIQQSVDSLRASGPPNGESPHLVTLVFHRLSNEGRRFANQAARDLLNEDILKEGMLSIFAIDRRLYALQSFTNDIEACQNGLKLATSGSYERFMKASNEIHRDLGEDFETSRIDRFDQITYDILERTQQMQREEAGYAVLDSLLAIAGELGSIPGRKVIVFLSEGFEIPQIIVDRLDFLVSEATLSGVAIYTVDARGLRTGGMTESATDLLRDAAQAAQSQVGTGEATVERVRAIETASRSLRLNTQETLHDLAERTGGFLITNTNDSRPGMKRIKEEVNSYYQITYSPSEVHYNGAFREIALKLIRPGAKLRAPAGYLDLPPAGRHAMPYEIPMLLALERGTLSNDFDLHAQILRFGRTEGGIQHTFALSLPLKNITFSTDPETKLYSTYFSLLGLLKDANGEVVERFSQDYPLQGPMDKLEKLKNGDVLFLRNFSHAPGEYALEAAAIDHVTRTTSTLRSPLTIRPWPEGPEISSLIVIDRADAVSDDTKDRNNPLRYEDKKIAPNLTGKLFRAPNALLALYCVIYPSPHITEQPKLRLVFIREGTPLFQGQPPLSERDESGRIQVVLNMPLEKLEVGDYEVVAVLMQGESQTEERVRFTVLD